ncbi:MAG: DNA starvation/stationary phase protection protein [Pirellulaceae bacterium]
MSTTISNSNTKEKINPNPQLSGLRGKVEKSEEVIDIPIGLSREDRCKTVQQLNQLLADTIMLQSMYKKHHWQVAGPTFYQIHLLLDKHYEEQAALVDTIAERIQLLGGVAAGMPAEVAAKTQIPHPPAGREALADQLTRLLGAHETICNHCRFVAKSISERGDVGTEDMLVGQVLRTNEFQAWFVAEHLVPVPLES